MALRDARASEARRILTSQGDPYTSPGPEDAPASATGDPGTGSQGRASQGRSRRDRSADAAGLGPAIAGVRASAKRLIDAHAALLRAELADAGRELGIIVGLAFAAFVLATLLGVLLFVGTFLFLGEWLFGSMAWGLVHGTLLTLALITGIGLNLAGAWMGAYSRGFLWGGVTTVVLSLLFASNVLRAGAVNVARELEDAVALHPDLLPTLVGLVAGGLMVALVAAIAGWRMGWQSSAVGRLALAGLALGAVLGAILGSVQFDNSGAVAVSLVLGLLTWMVVAVGLAAGRGFDPEARYAALVPRQTIAAFEETREFLMRQWERQKRRIFGR